MNANLPAVDIGRCFEESVDVFKRNAFLLIIAALVFQIISGVTLLILAGPLYGGVCLMMLSALSRPDRKVDVGQMFAMLGRFLPLLGLFFITLIPILIGTILLLIPGLLLATMWMFVFHLMIDKHMGVSAALNASWQVVRRRGLGFNFLLAVILFGLELACAIPYLGLLLSLVLMPIAWGMVTSAYIQEVRERESDLADILTHGFPVVPIAPPPVPPDLAGGMAK